MALVHSGPVGLRGAGYSSANCRKPSMTREFSTEVLAPEASVGARFPARSVRERFSARVPEPEPEPKPQPEPRDSIGWPLCGRWLATYSSSASFGGSGPSVSCRDFNRLAAGRRPGLSIPTQNPQTFPSVLFFHLNNIPARSNSDKNASTSVTEISGRLKAYAWLQTRRDSASKVPFANASGKRFAYSARNFSGTRDSFSERQIPSPSTTRFGTGPRSRGGIRIVPPIRTQHA